MAKPVIAWDLWSAASIQPSMRALVYFPSGTIVYGPEDLSSVSLTLAAFDSTCTMFGKPTPDTGSIVFMDYDQTLNPTYNDELAAGIKIELQMTVEGYTKGGTFGPNLVTSQEANVQVLYEGDTVWAVPFWVSEALEQGEQYELSFDYVLPDGSAGTSTQTGTAEELFYTPVLWPDNRHLAVVYPENLTVTNLSIRIVGNDWEPYGTFYATEWSYDSTGCSATVQFVEALSDVLTVDNRADAVLPYQNASLTTWLSQLLAISFGGVDFDITDDYTLKYAFYEDSQSTTITKEIEALGGMLTSMPDGTYAIYDTAGYYETGITLTDNDVESYSFEQTTSVSMDSIVVNAMLPSIAESSELAKYTDYSMSPNDFAPLNVGRVMSVDYLQAVTDNLAYPPYDWDVTHIQYLGSNVVEFNQLSVRGTVVDASPVQIYNVLGSLPYTIKDNYYIQSIAQAQSLADKLDAFLDMRYRIITVTLRGGFGLWLGAKLSVNSERYNIDADYIVIGMSFTYTGGIETTLTLQREV